MLSDIVCNRRQLHFDLESPYSYYSFISEFDENKYQSSNSPLHRPPEKPIDFPRVSKENVRPKIPKFIFRLTSPVKCLDEEADQRPNGEISQCSLEDGNNWRAYGRRQYKGSNLCCYYKCTQTNCVVKKVEKSREGLITEIVYKGIHNHPKPSSKLAIGLTSALDGTLLYRNEQVAPGGEGYPVQTSMEESAADRSQNNLSLSLAELKLLQFPSDSVNGQAGPNVDGYPIQTTMQISTDAAVSLGGENSTTYTSLQTISTIRTSDGSSGSKYSSESIADSHSSLRSTCRKLETSSLPSPSCKRRKANLTIPDLNLNTTGEDVALHVTPPDAPVQDVKMVNIKAKFKNDYIVFPLLLSSGMAGLVNNVTTRLRRFNVKKEDFIIKYQDSDGDWVLVALDEDLQACMSSLGLVDQSTIRMLVEPINAQ